jgi:hypothetical protein
MPRYRRVGRRPLIWPKPMAVARDPATGRFVTGNCGGPGRPREHEFSVPRLQALLLRELLLIDKLGDRGGMAQAMRVLDGPLCRQCGRSLGATGWRAKREFCSAACNKAWRRDHRTPYRLEMIEHMRRKRAALKGPAGPS